MHEELPIWIPDDARATASGMSAFRQWCAYEYRVSLDNPDAFHAWSIEEPADFWRAVWSYCKVIGKPGPRTLVDGHDMLAARFFPDGRLNFAQNLLRETGSSDALVFRGEDKREYTWSWDYLSEIVSRLQQAFRASGVKAGDRVAAMMPNMPETIACMLAAASIGAVWSSCSPDFGEQGVIDRFAQIDPSLFIACDGYWYAGNRIDIGAKVRAIAERLGCPVLIVPYTGDADALAASIGGAVTMDAFMAPWPASVVEYVDLPFSHPLFILFSSGTTGLPKCIVHSAGGTLLQHLKEHQFHCDITRGDRVFYFTTCGWMMWNWLASALASRATLVLYDGSPLHPSKDALLSLAGDERVTFFGTSAKYIDTLRKAGEKPKLLHDLSQLRVIASTGSPLSQAGYDYVYDNIKHDVQLSSISGGTDIVSCFVLGNPTRPVWRGEITGPGLGMAVDVWDDNGRSTRTGTGELVCTKPFPSMPLGFWGHDGVARYRAAYFDRFGTAWCQGDLAEWTRSGGLVIHGRSDATLNPGGVRIGTAEIYNLVEALEEVNEALCVGQEFEGDVRIVLFLHLRDGHQLGTALQDRVKLHIRNGASPRHIPAVIIQVNDLPRTRSGKIAELAVREIIHGRLPRNIEALANPLSLGQFENHAELWGRTVESAG